ncbi:hypothetical protein D3C87_2112130 [compost metagenome]
MTPGSLADKLSLFSTTNSITANSSETSLIWKVLKASSYGTKMSGLPFRSRVSMLERKIW